MVIQAVVSYRSVPRILALLNAGLSLNLDWIPHFTSVINWTLRLGLGLLNQVKPSGTPWLAIIDHSIDIGTKKALVVLRVNVATLAEKGRAIRLEDCECIGLKVCEQVNGERIAQDLDDIFKRAGSPRAIIKDGDYTLAKGVRLWTEKQAKKIPVISDIGHALANALKAEFENTPHYTRFVALTQKAAKRLRQTEFAFLIPPKLRSKGRFQSISPLARWADRMLGVLSVPGRAAKGSVLAKLRAVMPGFLTLKPFIQEFAHTARIVAQVMERLKNHGLDQARYEQCRQLSETLPARSGVKMRLQHWLQQHLAVQKQLTDLPLLVSSDIIESLFGNFKHIIERSPQADMNRSVLLLPALCGRLDPAAITRTLQQTRHKDLEEWEQHNIPYTVRKKRQAFWDDNGSQKTGIS